MVRLGCTSVPEVMTKKCRTGKVACLILNARSTAKVKPRRNGINQIKSKKPESLSVTHDTVSLKKVRGNKMKLSEPEKRKSESQKLLAVDEAGKAVF